MQIDIKNHRRVVLIHPDSRLPSKTYEEDAGYDVYNPEEVTLYPNQIKKVALGIAIEIRRGEMCTIRSRSSTKARGVACAENTCDAGYTGQLFAMMVNHTTEPVVFKKNERIVQLVFVNINHSDELIQGPLPVLSRGSKGFGSSGK